MLAMSFGSFLVLLVVGAVVALVYHYAFRYRFLEGWDSLVGKVAIGWLGAWLGSPVLGHWLWPIEQIYVVPAILGAAMAIHLNVLWWKARAKVNETRQVGPTEQRPSGMKTAA
jgi:uncharacterized membrane protein YeaQ/YmgE (transglycosylase-associated protein family)